METLSILGLFCEDIRQESGGVLTLVGLLPDNVSVEVPKEGALGNEPSKENKFLTKICVFARANFDPAAPPKTIELKLVLPGDVELPLGGADPKIIEDAKTQAKEKGLPLAGIVMQAILAGFRPAGPGVIRLKAVIDGEARTLAMLNFQFTEAATSPIAH